MSPDIVLMGERGSIRNGFVNLMVGLPLIPGDDVLAEQMAIRIGGESPAGIWTSGNRERKSPVDDLAEYSRRENKVRLLEVNLPDHPALRRGLAWWYGPSAPRDRAWDPSVVRNFLDHKDLDPKLVLFFASGRPNKSTLDLIRDLPKLRGRTILVITPECATAIEAQRVTSEVAMDLSRSQTLPVQPFYMPTVLGAFRRGTAFASEGWSDWEAVMMWRDIRVSVESLLAVGGAEVLGDDLLESAMVPVVDEA